MTTRTQHQIHHVVSIHLVTRIFESFTNHTYQIIDADGGIHEIVAFAYGDKPVEFTAGPDQIIARSPE
jgi:hypothetical protein